MVHYAYICTAKWYNTHVSVRQNGTLRMYLYGKNDDTTNQTKERLSNLFEQKINIVQKDWHL